MTNNDVLNLISQTIKINSKLTQIKNKRKMYQDELKLIQQKYLIELNKSKNEADSKIIVKNLNQDMINLNNKYFENKEDTKQKA